MSHGIPAIHQVNPALKPPLIPFPTAPMTTYGIAHIIPKNNPKSEEKMLQNQIDFSFRKTYVNNTKNGHMYKYIITHSCGPYMLISININTGTTNRIFHPKYSVKIISQKVVSSIFGKKLKLTLQTSITATIRPISAISLIVSLDFPLFCHIHGINDTISLAVSYRLAVNTIITILIIYIKCPISTVCIIISSLAVHCFHHHTIFALCA